jgi:hypothetical protein
VRSESGKRRRKKQREDFDFSAINRTKIRV